MLNNLVKAIEDNLIIKINEQLLSMIVPIHSRMKVFNYQTATKAQKTDRQNNQLLITT